MRGLTRGQAKNLEELDYRLVTDSYDAMVLDPKDFCGLMASECFKIEKCVLYSRSASLSCRECPTRYPLEDTKNAIWTVRGTRMATQGTCEKCEQDKTLVAANQCHRCKYGDWKDLSKSEVLKLIAGGNVRMRKKLPPPVEPKPPLQEALEGAKVLTDFSKDQPLFEKILESARRSRRPAGQEVLHLLDTALNSGSGIPSKKLLKIVDRIRTYPVPNGSPKEVFQAALDMVSNRIQEISDESQT